MITNFTGSVNINNNVDISNSFVVNIPMILNNQLTTPAG
jgi:hypothetical protein